MYVKPVIHGIPFCYWMKEATCNNWQTWFLSPVFLCSEFKLENICSGVNFLWEKCLRQFLFAVTYSGLLGKAQELETAKISSNTVCVPHLILTQKLKPSYLAAPSVLSVSFLDFSARESLMSFNSWLSLPTSSSPMPPSPDSPLALSKDCSDKKEALYLSVIVFNGHFIWWYCYFTRSSAPPDSLAACSTRAKEEHSFLGYFKTLSIGLAWEFKLRPPTCAILTELILLQLKKQRVAKINFLLMITTHDQEKRLNELPVIKWSSKAIIFSHTCK